MRSKNESDPSKVFNPSYTRSYNELISARPTSKQTADLVMLDNQRDSAEVIIDIGSGPGNSTEVIKNLYPNAEKIVGLDLNPGFLEQARRQVGGDFMIGRSQFLPFKDQTVDRIFCCNSIHWFAFDGNEESPKHLDVSLKEFSRVLRSEGKLFFNTTGLQFKLTPEEMSEAVTKEGIPISVHYLEHPFHNLFLLELNELLKENGVEDPDLIVPEKIDKYHNMFNLQNIRQIFTHAGFELISSEDAPYKITFLPQTKEQFLSLIRNGSRMRYFNTPARSTFSDQEKNYLIEEAIRISETAHSQLLEIPSHAVFISFFARKKS